MALWLAAHQPPDALDPAVVHGDFKLDNVLLDPLEPARLVAVFDWEMAALGDPLIDLGILLAYWTPMDGPAQPDALTAVTGREGYMNRDQVIDRYAEVSGRDLSDIPYFEAFASSRLPLSSSRSTTASAAGRPTTLDLRGSAIGSWLWQRGLNGWQSEVRIVRS